MQAVRFSRVQDVVSLLASGSCEVDAQQSEGISALMLAAQYGYVDIVEKLIRAGSDVRLVDDRGWNALFFAASNGHLDVCKALLDAGCNKSTVDGAGHFAATIASMNGHTAVTQLLTPEPATRADGSSGVSSVAFELQFNSLTKRLESVEAETKQLRGRLRRSAFLLFVCLSVLALFLIVGAYYLFVKDDKETSTLSSQPGLKVSGSALDASGNMVVTFSDGSSIKIPPGAKGDVGPRGPEGSKGTPGRSISIVSSVVDASGKVTLVMSDNTTVILPAHGGNPLRINGSQVLPGGVNIYFSDGSNVTIPRGDYPYIGITKVSQDPTGDVTLRFSDGNVTRIPAGRSTPCDCGVNNVSSLALPYERIYSTSWIYKDGSQSPPQGKRFILKASIPKFSCSVPNCYGVVPSLFLRFNYSTESTATTSIYSTMFSSPSGNPIPGVTALHAYVNSSDWMPAAVAVASVVQKSTTGYMYGYKDLLAFVDGNRNVMLAINPWPGTCPKNVPIDENRRAGKSMSFVSSRRSGLYTISFHDVVASRLLQLTCYSDFSRYGTLFEQYRQTSDSILMSQACAFNPVNCSVVRTVQDHVTVDPTPETIFDKHGFPVTVFRGGNDSISAVYLHFCLSDTCIAEDSRLVRLQTSVTCSPQEPAAALGIDGNLVVVYYCGNGGGLFIIHCEDSWCFVQSQPRRLTAGSGIGIHPAIAIGADGLPVISFVNRPEHTVEVIHCLSVDCITADRPAVVGTNFAEATTTRIAIPQAQASSVFPAPVVFFANEANSAGVRCSTLSCHEKEFPMSALGPEYLYQVQERVYYFWP
jgi:hypothetical protein